MRVRLAAILVVLALIILVAKRAHASCAIEEAYLGTTSVPVGCKLTVYVRGDETIPTVVALRGGQRVDVTGAITSEMQLVPIFIETDRCNGVGMTSQYPMMMLSIELESVVAGDTLELQGFTTEQIGVVAATTCAAPVQPHLFCPDDKPPMCNEDIIDHDDDDGGCSTGGTPMIGVALALLGLVRRRSSM